MKLHIISSRIGSNNGNTYNQIGCVTTDESFGDTKYCIAKQTPNYYLQSTEPKKMRKYTTIVTYLKFNCNDWRLIGAYLSEMWPASGIVMTPPNILIVPMRANLYSFSSHKILNLKKRTPIISLKKKTTNCNRYEFTSFDTRCSFVLKTNSVHSTTWERSNVTAGQDWSLAGLVVCFV